MAHGSKGGTCDGCARRALQVLVSNAQFLVLLWPRSISLQQEAACLYCHKACFSVKREGGGDPPFGDGL